MINQPENFSNKDNLEKTLNVTTQPLNNKNEDALELAEQTIAIPVIKEAINIGIKSIDTGKGIRAHKSVIEQPHTIDELLQHEALEIKHVVIDEIVLPEDAPVSRYEGNKFIVSVLEEILVVEKRIRVKEEIHIIKTQHESLYSETVLLKQERVTTKRFDENLPVKS